MRKKRRRSRPESFYQRLVEKYVAREYRCVTVRELNLSGPKFDVVGFSPHNEEFHIVECKRTTRLVSVGQAFGQILAYKAVIFDGGEAFLTSFERALTRNKVTRQPFWIHGARFAKARKIPVRFYIALRGEALARPDILRLIKQDLPGVGIIRINKSNKCRNYIRALGEKDYDLCRATRVEVPIDPPIHPELRILLDQKGSSRSVCALAVKLDGRIKRLRRGIKSVRRGHDAMYYRVARNFVGIKPRKQHIHVSIKEGRGWSRHNVSSGARLSHLMPRIRKALERSLQK